MKSVRKMISLLASAGLTLSLMAGVYAPAVSAEEIVFEGYEISRLESFLKEFEDGFSGDIGEKEAEELYTDLIRETDYISLQLSLSKIQHSQNMTEENFDKFAEMNTVSAVADNLIEKSLVKVLKGKNGKLLKNLLGDFSEEDMKEPDDASAEQSAEFIEKKNELLRRFTQIDVPGKSENEKNLECAEVYLEAVKLYNSLTASQGITYFEHAYDMFSRDYTPEQVEKISAGAAEVCADAVSRIYARMMSIMDASSDPSSITFDDNMQIISMFSQRVSDELRESAEEVRNRNLYITASGSESDPDSYTTLLSYYDTAMIYHHLNGNVNDLRAATHEFGHFNSMRLNCIPAVFITGHNLDIAELQSQGLEVLYTDFYDAIYGKNAEILRLNEISELIGVVAAGFQCNEFEKYVFDNADSLTPEQVVSKYTELVERYKIYDVPLYRISHFIQSPGYYISYSMSALAALDLWDVMYRDFDRAAEMYTDLTHISMYDGTGYSEALETAGFDNVLSEEFLVRIVDDIVTLVVSGLVFGDVDGNGTVNTADLTALKNALLNASAVINDENRRVFDINNDSAVTAADIVRLKIALSK